MSPSTRPYPILNSAEDFSGWLAYIHHVASSRGVWQYVDPDRETKVPSLYDLPGKASTRQTPSTVELNTFTLQQLQFMKFANEEIRAQLAAVEFVNNAIWESIGEEASGRLRDRECFTARSRIATLQRMYR